MSAPEFSFADELRFLAAQCAAHAEGTHRDQDRQFVASLVMQLTILGEEKTSIGALIIAAVIAADTKRCQAEHLPGEIRLAALRLNHEAALLDRKVRKVVAA